MTQGMAETLIYEDVVLSERLLRELAKAIIQTQHDRTWFDTQTIKRLIFVRRLVRNGRLTEDPAKMRSYIVR